MPLTIFILPIILIFYFSACLKIVKEWERFVVFRLGRFHKILKPGIGFTLWPHDHVVKIDLNRDIPDWQNLSDQELDERVKQVAISKNRSLG